MVSFSLVFKPRNFPPEVIGKNRKGTMCFLANWTAENLGQDVAQYVGHLVPSKLQFFFPRGLGTLR